jgi:serine protease Do
MNGQEVEMEGITQHRRVGILPYVLGVILGISIGLAVVSAVLFYRSSRGSASPFYRQTSAQEEAQVSAGASITDSRRNAIVIATEKVAPAVVSVSATRTRIVRRSPFASPFSRDWFERYFGTYEKKSATLGSGVMINADGYLLTNEHVVHEGEEIIITLSSGEALPGTLIGSSPEYDLALVKVNAENHPFTSLGDSDDLLVGEWVLAIGSPFGQLMYDTQPTVTVGVISAVDRDVKSSQQSTQIFKGMIQTDAAINPGNSGGPLVNSRGEVIGINTFIFSAGDGGNLGMGFAIPINRGKWILDELLAFGRVRSIWTGLMVAEVTPELAVGLDLKTNAGLLVSRVEENGPASKAGLKPGDLILKINGRIVRNLREADRIIFGSRVGDDLVFDIDSKGKLRQVSLALEERPSEF